jgi:hypothetical protein
MQRFIITEEDKRNILGMYGLLTEDLEEPSKQMTINGNSFFKNGMWKKLSDDAMTTLQNELKKIVVFLKNNLKQGMVVSVKINAGESNVTNHDNESPEKPAVKPGYLSERRAETMKTILTTYFNDLISEKIISEMPKFEKFSFTPGSKTYVKNKDNPNDSKYKKDRFVNVEIKLVSEPDWDKETIYLKPIETRLPNLSQDKEVPLKYQQINFVPEKKQCVNNMEIEIYYDDAKKPGNHVCNSSIYNIYLNNVQLIRNDGKTYASLNNNIKKANEKLKPYDNLPTIQGGSRSNTFIITPEISDKILKKNDKILTLSAKCINPTNYKGDYGFGCHNGVGNIRVTNGKGVINSYQAVTPKDKNEFKTIATFDSCGNPLVTK